MKICPLLALGCLLGAGLPQLRAAPATLPFSALAAAPSASAHTHPVSAPVNELAEVNGTRVIVRALPTTKSAVLAQLNAPDLVIVLEDVTRQYPMPNEPATWCRVGWPWWIHARFVETATRTVTAQRLNVRSGPGEGHRIVGELERGARVQVAETNGNWLRLEVQPASLGFVAAGLLKRKSTPFPAVPNPAMVMQPVRQTTPPSAPAPAEMAATNVVPPRAADLDTARRADRKRPVEPEPPLKQAQDDLVRKETAAQRASRGEADARKLMAPVPPDIATEAPPPKEKSGAPAETLSPTPPQADAPLTSELEIIPAPVPVSIAELPTTPPAPRTPPTTETPAGAPTEVPEFTLQPLPKSATPAANPTMSTPPDALEPKPPTTVAEIVPEPVQPFALTNLTNRAVAAPEGWAHRPPMNAQAEAAARVLLDRTFSELAATNAALPVPTDRKAERQVEKKRQAAAQAELDRRLKEEKEERARQAETDKRAARAAEQARQEREKAEAEAVKAAREEERRRREAEARSAAATPSDPAPSGRQHIKDEATPKVVAPEPAEAATDAAKPGTPPPIAPVMPLTKSQRLKQLTEDYVAGKLTAEEYHRERRRLVAEP